MTRKVLPGKPCLRTALRAAFSSCWRRNWRTIDLYLTLGDAVIASLSRSGQFERRFGRTLVSIFGLSSKRSWSVKLDMDRTSVSIFEISSETVVARQARHLDC